VWSLTPEKKKATRTNEGGGADRKTNTAAKFQRPNQNKGGGSKGGQTKVRSKYGKGSFLTRKGGERTVTTSDYVSYALGSKSAFEPRKERKMGQTRSLAKRKKACGGG